ncbi:MAG: hypothetical protein Q8Q89_02140 [bacterium]|nr:hypothetical protein [bacterium]
MISSKHIPTILAISVAILAVTVGVISIFPAISSLKYDSYDKNDFIDSDAYQAVFLTNDQIYFGRLKNISSDYLILSDVYYVKINEEGAGQLVKLGVGEPHGPKDEMIINQDQVLFWENMRFDSQVVKTIQSIKQK